MAIPILSPVDHNLNEIRNVIIHLLASDPVSPTVGQIWYNTTSNTVKYYDGAVRVLAQIANTLDVFGAPAADLSINSHKLTTVALGLDVKASVVVATTAAGTLASSFANGSTVDGISLTTGMRILIKNQASPADNGIYTVNASGAPTRSTDCNSSANYLAGIFVFVEEGTVNAASSWIVTTQGTITVGSTSVTWAQFSGSGSYTAGSGLTLTGSSFAVNVTGTSTEISGGNVRVKSNATSGQPLLSQGTGNEANYGALNLAGGASFVTGATPIANGGTASTTAAAALAALGGTTKFSVLVGDGSTTSIVVTHNLNTRDVHVTVYSNTTPWAEVEVEIQHTSVNTCTIVFSVAPTSNQFRVVVIG
jgi:hypothetical protein